MALKLITHLPCDPAGPLPTTDPEEWKHMHTNRKQLEFPAGECTQTPVQKSSGTLLLCEKDPTTDTGNTLPGKQHTECRKPDTHDDIPQDPAPNCGIGKPQGQKGDRWLSEVQEWNGLQRSSREPLKTAEMF